MFGNKPGGGSGQGMKGSDFTYPQLDHASISKFISDFSVAVKIWKAIKCPCTTPETGQPQINCNSCYGLGFVYGEPEAAPEYQRAQVHSRRATRRDGKGGDFIQGYASVTFMPGIIPGDGDIVQVCADKEVVNEEYHVFGSTLNNGATAERLRFRDIVCVEKVMLWDSMTKQALEAPVGSWEFSKEERRIKFKQEISTGTKYSLRYVAVPEYVVVGESAKPLTRVAHDDGSPYPINIRKDVNYSYNCQCVRLDRAIIQRHKLDVQVKHEGSSDIRRSPFT